MPACPPVCVRAGWPILAVASVGNTMIDGECRLPKRNSRRSLCDPPACVPDVALVLRSEAPSQSSISEGGRASARSSRRWRPQSIHTSAVCQFRRGTLRPPGATCGCTPSRSRAAGTSPAWSDGRARSKVDPTTPAPPASTGSASSIARSECRITSASTPPKANAHPAAPSPPRTTDPYAASGSSSPD